MPEIVRKKAKHICKISQGTDQKKGIGSGILVANNIVLVARHCVEKNREYGVTFGLNSTNSKGDTYTARLPDPERAQELARQYGLCHGDFALLEIQPVPDQKLPGEKYGCTPLENLEGTKPSRLYYFGFGNGTSNKFSFAGGRQHPLQICLENHVSIENRFLTWNQGKYPGQILSVNVEKGKVKVFSQNEQKDRKFIVRDGQVFGSRNNLQLAFRHPDEFQVELPLLHGADHVLTANKTSPGGSGGIYFDEHGRIYAMHIGAMRLPKKNGNLSLKMHVGFFPYKDTSTHMYNEYLALEIKELEKLEGGLVNCKIHGITDRDGNELPTVYIDAQQAKHSLWYGQNKFGKGNRFPPIGWNKNSKPIEMPADKIVELATLLIQDEQFFENCGTNKNWNYPIQKHGAIDAFLKGVYGSAAYIHKFNKIQIQAPDVAKDGSVSFHFFPIG